MAHHEAPRIQHPLHALVRNPDRPAEAWICKLGDGDTEDSQTYSAVASGDWLKLRDEVDYLLAGEEALHGSSALDHRERNLDAIKEQLASPIVLDDRDKRPDPTQLVVKVHEIKPGNYPAVKLNEATSSAFIFDGCIVSGWPLDNEYDDDGYPLWEADSDVGQAARKFSGVRYWVEFPVKLYTIGRGTR